VDQPGFEAQMPYTFALIFLPWLYLAILTVRNDWRRPKTASTAIAAVASISRGEEIKKQRKEKGGNTMKKVMGIIFTVLLFATLATTAKAEKYFTGDVVFDIPYDVPAAELQFNDWMCITKMSSLGGTSYQISFDITPSCSESNAYRFGFSDDDRIVITLDYNGQPGFIISQYSARELRDGVEYAPAGIVPNQGYREVVYVAPPTAKKEKKIVRILKALLAPRPCPHRERWNENRWHGPQTYGRRPNFPNNAPQGHRGH